MKRGLGRSCYHVESTETPTFMFNLMMIVSSVGSSFRSRESNASECANWRNPLPGSENNPTVTCAYYGTLSGPFVESCVTPFPYVRTSKTTVVEPIFLDDPAFRMLRVGDVNAFHKAIAGRDKIDYSETPIYARVI